MTRKSIFIEFFIKVGPQVAENAMLVNVVQR